MKTDWERLSRVLGQHSPPTELIYAESCASTNNIVRDRFSEAGSPNIVLAGTDYQKQGRGLHGHKWISKGGCDVLFTLGFKPKAFGYTADTRLPLCIGIILQQTIRTAFGIILRCKWPNDLITNDGRKAGGILVLNYADYIAIGVGINVNSLPEDFLEELQGKAITLREIIGHELDQTLVLLTIVPELLKHITSEPGYRCADLMKHWEYCANGIGYPMLITYEGKQETVTPVRINTETGELIVARGYGAELSLSSAQHIGS